MFYWKHTVGYTQRIQIQSKEIGGTVFVPFIRNVLSMSFQNDCVENVVLRLVCKSIFHSLSSKIYFPRRSALNFKWNKMGNCALLYSAVHFKRTYWRHLVPDSDSDFDYTLIAINLWNFACRFVQCTLSAHKHT